MEAKPQKAKVRAGATSKWSAWLKVAERWLSMTEDTLTAIGGGLIVVIVAISVAEVVGRYALAHTVPGKTEIEDLFMGALVFCGFAITQRKRRHVRMDMFLDMLFKGRAYWAVESFTTLLALAVYGLITAYGAEAVVSSYQVGDATGYLWWPIWPFKLFLPVGSALLCLRIIFQLPVYLLRAVVGEKPKKGEEWIQSGSVV